MTTLKLAVLPDRTLKDGKHKIRVSISHKSDTRYILTPYVIDNISEFKNGQVINRPDASIMNSRLRKKMNFYHDVLESIPNADRYSCTELKELLTSRKDYCEISYMQVAEEYLSELSGESRNKSEKLYRLASKTFIKYEGNLQLADISCKHIQHFKSSMRAKPLSPTTIKIYLTLVKVIINYAKKA